MPDLSDKKIAIFCVGNKLMLDEGIGNAVYEELTATYTFPENVHLFDLGCLGLHMVNLVDEYDYMISVDAVDGTGDAPGTIYEFMPEDMARHSGAMASLHELKLVDLFDAANLLGFTCDGKCFGMQIENMSPAEITIGLTKPVYEALPHLIEVVLAELVNGGIVVIDKKSGTPIKAGWSHELTESDDFDVSAKMMNS